MEQDLSLEKERRLESALRICKSADFSAAAAFQRETAPLAVFRDNGAPVSTAGGVDLSYHDTRCHCAIVVVARDSLNVVAEAHADLDVEFPYVPGYLFFREFPAFLAAWEKLAFKPDVLMFDGHGLAHPRRAGIAVMAGVLLDVAAIGVGKSRLYGKFEEPGKTRFDSTPLLAPDGTQLGWTLRTRGLSSSTGDTRAAKPVFVSPGHRVSMAGCLELTKAFTGKWRIPAPTREAHLAAGRWR